MATSISFSTTPSSLSSFFPVTSREHYQRRIIRITFTASGEVILQKQRVDGGSTASIFNFNLNDANGHWRYIVGSENVTFFLAFRKRLSELKSGIKLYSDLTFDQVGRFADLLVVEDSSWAGEGSPRQNALESLLDNVIADRTILSDNYSQGSMVEGDYLTIDPSGFGGYQYFYEDYLIGTEYADSVLGYRGKDTLDGNQGDDELYGGYGHDQLYGRDGNDYLYGEQGSDRLEGGNGDDYLDGGLGSDTLIGGAGNDTYLIDRPSDIISDLGATTDVDIVIIPIFMTYSLPFNIEDCELTGRYGSSVNGNSLNNDLMGNNGNNSLSGGLGMDEITGGLGDDTLIGGAGNDALVGGVGKDLFRFTSSSVTGALGQGTDEIIDFQKGIDKIQIVKSGFKVGTAAIASLIISSSPSNVFGSGANFHFNTATCDLLFKGQATAIADVLGVTSLSAADFSLI